MIEYIEGVLALKLPTVAVIDINGLGYRVLIPTSTYDRLPSEGSKARLLCHQHVREDALILFGFASKEERSLFDLLIGVSGIGPKLALAALSAMPARELSSRIASGDADVLTRIPGVGRKTAQRMIVELRDRVTGGSLESDGDTTAGDPRSEARSDARSALEALGLSGAAAEKKLRDVLNAHPDAESAEDLIRLALRM